MNLTGTYAVANGKVMKLTDAIPSLKRPVPFNKGGTKEFDVSARRTFYSKQERRSWMIANKLRESGIIHPDQPPA